MATSTAPAAPLKPPASTSPASTWAAIYLGVAAATLPAVLPVMVGVFADRFGYGVAGAGMIAGLNMTGILVGSLLCPLITAHFGWAGVIRASLAVMIAGNLLTMLDGHFGYVAAARVFSGLGEGVVGGICYAAMGRSARPERSISIYFAGQAIVGMVGLGSFGWIAASLGWPWLFLILSAIALPGFWLAAAIGRAQPAPAGARHGGLPVNPLVIGALACILLYFVGMASLWPFFERIGVGKGITAGTIAFALSVSAFGGLTGSLVTSVVAERLPRVVGLLSGLVLLIAAVSGLAFLPGTTSFMLSVSLFAFTWPFQFAFQFGHLASLDRGGRLIALTPAMTGGGLAIGPAIGGMLLQNLSLGAVSAFCILCVIVAVGGAIALRPRQAV